MHVAARQFVEQALAAYGEVTGDVVEFGSRNANGGVRDLFPHARSYLGIDSMDGPGVDLVQNAALWHPAQAYGCVITTETFEHTPQWRDMLRAGARAMAPDGIMLVTCATGSRPRHSATIAGRPPAPGEYYANVRETDFKQAIDTVGLQASVTIHGNDLYAVCRPRPPEGPGIKLIGAGMWRTGTVSLKDALEDLLGAPAHHMTEVLRHPHQTQQWLLAARGVKPNWQTLLQGYGSTLDWPSMAFWPDLHQTYPEALVLLSTRDPEEWWQSINTTVLRSAPTAETARSAWDHLVLTLFEQHFVGRFPSKQQAIDAYNQHNDLVRKAVPPNRLLEWEPEDGWTPLCRALDKPRPVRPFPHLNTRANYRRNNRL